MPLDPTIAIVFGTLFLSFLFSLLYAFWYQQFKYKHKTPKRREENASPESIRVSELEALIHKAVAEATLPLEERLATLEADVTSLQDSLGQDLNAILPERRAAPLLAVPDDNPEEEKESYRARRQVR